jgi:hypothetical protein
MKTTMKLALMTMAFGSTFFSCKKEKSSESGCAINMANLSGAYKLTALQYQASANAASADYLAFMDDCEKDDILNLKTDGTYVSDDAGAVCNPATTSQGTWQLHGNTLTSDGTLNGIIASYDCKTLVYYIENSIKPGDKLTFTLVKQ